MSDKSDSNEISREELDEMINNAGPLLLANRNLKRACLLYTSPSPRDRS